MSRGYGIFSGGKSFYPLRLRANAPKAPTVTKPKIVPGSGTEVARVNVSVELFESKTPLEASATPFVPNRVPRGEFNPNAFAFGEPVTTN